MPYIVSTMSAPVRYTLFEGTLEGEAKIARPGVVRKSIQIAGGAHVQNKVYTPDGVATQVTDEELEILRKNKVFGRQLAKGFLKIVNPILGSEPNADKVAADMEVHDDSAQLAETLGDFVDGGRAAGPAPSDNTVE